MNIIPQHIIDLLNLRAGLNGFKVICKEEFVKAPWYLYPVRTYTWGLYPADYKPGSTKEHLVGPLFTCSNKPLPESTKTPKYREFKEWSRQCSEYMTQHSTKGN